VPVVVADRKHTRVIFGNMFSFKATNGGLGFADMTKARFKEHLKEHEGQTYDIMLRKKRRTLTQNAYWHVLIGHLSDYTGHAFGEMKTIIKRRHLKPIETEAFGEKQMTLPSSASLNNLEMSELIEKTLADCAWYSIIVPTREELGYSPK